MSECPKHIRGYVEWKRERDEETHRRWNEAIEKMNMASESAAGAQSPSGFHAMVAVAAAERAVIEAAVALIAGETKVEHYSLDLTEAYYPTGVYMAFIDAVAKLRELRGK